MSVKCPNCQNQARTGAQFCGICGTALVAVAQAPPGRLVVGQELNGRYKVVRPFSKGGMGAIYLVEDSSAFGKQRVVKEMLDYVERAEFSDDATYNLAVLHAHQRFEEEARTLAGLRHRGIPDIMEYFSENKRNYIVMEYIEGANLEQRLTHSNDQGLRVPGQPYAIEDVIRYGIQVCKVLEYLTALPKPVVHQDIKPANLIVGQAGEVRLVDFGTAKARFTVQPGGKVGLQKSSVYGTVGYAPPEQYQGQSEPRSDVYALAATLYHLATDDDPRSNPFKFSRLPSLPQGLWAALDVALQHDVKHRPVASQLRGQLEALLAPRVSAEPIHLRGGAVARNVVELVQACDRHWEDGKFHLYRGDFEERLRKWGRTDLEAKTQGLRKQHANRDIGLDAFLRLLDAAYPPPRLNVTPTVQNMGVTPWGEQRKTQIEVQNTGHGCLQGRITAQSPWLRASQTEFTIHDRQTLTVTIDTKQMLPQDGRANIGHLLLDSGRGGQVQAEFRVIVPEPRIAFSPATIDLGEAHQGETRSARLIVSNQGGSPCDVHVVDSADWIKVSPERLRCEPGKQVTMSVKVDSSQMAVGAHKATVAMEASAGTWTREFGVPVVLELPWLKTFVRRHWVAVTMSSLLFAIFMSTGGMQLHRYFQYTRGQAMMAAGRWQQAAIAFTKAGNYADAPNQILETYYQAGLSYRSAQRWEDAVLVFARVGDYRDASEQILETHYQAGLSYMAEQRWEDAELAFTRVGDYRDASEQILETHYQAGLSYMAEQRWDDAAAEFAKTGNYRDAPDQMLKTFYQAGLSSLDEQHWEDAAAEFTQADSYGDASTRKREAYYQAGIVYLAEGQLEQAAATLLLAESHSGAIVQLQALVDKGVTIRHPKDGMVQLLVPAGDFLMGSADSDPSAKSNEKPQHSVYLDSYWIDQTEVTNTQWKCVMEGSCSPKINVESNYPVGAVSWNDAKTYCERVGRRLPTEAEWEKAARGTDGRIYPWGNQQPNSNLANLGNQVHESVSVGQYTIGVSPYGALDMAGNVMEWVADWYDQYYYRTSPNTNPPGPDYGTARGVRGGSWLWGSELARSASRFGATPTTLDRTLGFRCANSP